MSKISESKELQQYIDKPMCCCNCDNYKSEMISVKKEWAPEPFIKEKNLKCLIGNFKVKKMSSCKMYIKKNK